MKCSYEILRYALKKERGILQYIKGKMEYKTHVNLETLNFKLIRISNQRYHKQTNNY